MTSPRRPKDSVSPALTRVALDPEEPTAFACPSCSCPLDIQQPEADCPELLLGTCQDCGTWAAIGVDDEKGEALILELKGLRKALGILGLSVAAL